MKLTLVGGDGVGGGQGPRGPVRSLDSLRLEVFSPPHPTAPSEAEVAELENQVQVRVKVERHRIC